jgi:hypothetical protein
MGYHVRFFGLSYGKSTHTNSLKSLRSKKSINCTKLESLADLKSVKRKPKENQMNFRICLVFCSTFYPPIIFTMTYKLSKIFLAFFEKEGVYSVRYRS